MISPLVLTDWLAVHLNDENVRIVDIRGKVLPASQPPPHYFSHYDDYKVSHIPNAVFVDWTKDIVEPDSPSGDIASPERFADLMGQLGIDEDVTVIAYDDAESMFAARLWWALQYYGHEEAYVLDGGWKKWIAEDRPVESTMPDIAPRTFKPKMDSSLLKTGRDILNLLESDDIQLIDVRSPLEFNGEASRAKRAGHIPSAINLPRKMMVADDGTVLSTDMLRMNLASSAIQLDKSETIIYCNSGVSASYGMLAMRIAGLDNISVYDGSWKDWGNDESKPIE